MNDYNALIVMNEHIGKACVAKLSNTSKRVLY